MDPFNLLNEDSIVDEDAVFHSLCSELFSSQIGEKFSRELYRRIAKNRSCFSDCPYKTAYNLGQKELVEALITFSKLENNIFND